MFPPLWDCADEQRTENGLDLKISDFGISDSRFQISGDRFFDVAGCTRRVYLAKTRDLKIRSLKSFTPKHRIHIDIHQLSFYS